MIPKFKRRYCRKLFTWKELEYLINIRPLMTNERLSFYENITYEWEDNDCWNLDPNCYPPSLIKEILERGVCLFNDMSRCTPKINSFAKGLEKLNHLPCSAHIYVCRNPKAEHPFGIHFDTSDNVIVQCEGKTNFKVWDQVKDRSQVQDHMTLNDSPLLDVDMNPGDAIWIPRYHPHLATSKTSRMGVTFSQSNYLPTQFQDREWIKL